jgi:hypothetical protein
MNWMIRAGIALMVWGMATSLSAATHKSANFEVTAESADLAREIAVEAEKWRAKLARQWLKKPLADWESPCRIQVATRRTGGTGWTDYHFLGRRLVRVGIRLEGPSERLLEYVLPHELTHAVLVTALGEAMPRWADEGAAMLSESQSQQHRHRLRAHQLWKTGNLIPLGELLKTADYPEQKSQLHAFYAESFTLCDYLISEGGTVRFLQFVQDGHTDGWDDAVRRHYQLQDAKALERAWSESLQARLERRTADSNSEEIAAD